MTGPLGMFLLTLAQVACLSDPISPTQREDAHVLTARPGDVGTPLAPGRHELGGIAGWDGFIYVPTAHVPDVAAPLLILLHGATGSADNWVGTFSLADSLGLVLMVPSSQAQTWDAIRGAFGADISFIDRALEHVFEGVMVDPARITIGGFSDGASYALSVGIANGDLITHILAFSPGFIPAAPPQGLPKVFISHGTNDQILPIDVTSRQIVPELRALGYSVIYEEFEGRHEMPPSVFRQGFSWTSVP